MRYLIQRIVHNDLQWMRPSGGRLGSRLDGDYLAKHGFAHEDWNFEKAPAKDGYTHGYAYFIPRDSGEHFHIAFATYDKGGIWSLAGFYLNASFQSSGPDYPGLVIRERAEQLFSLKTKGDLGGKYGAASRARIATFLSQEIGTHYHWRVRQRDVHAATTPISVPQGMLPKSMSLYFTRPTDVSEATFNKLWSLASRSIDGKPVDDFGSGGDVEFPEGRPYQVQHTKRERSVALVKLVKSEFRRRYGRLYCQACKFDFENKYGQIGADFIEAHHLIPVSQLQPGSKTKVSDMVLVCSNCHRMLHRKRPWIDKASELKRLFRN